MQDSGATALRDVAAAGVPVPPAGDGDRQERHGADMAADLPAGCREGQPLAGPLRTKIPDEVRDQALRARMTGEAERMACTLHVAWD